VLPIFNGLNRSRCVMTCRILEKTPRVHRNFNPERIISRSYVASPKSLRERFVSQQSTHSSFAYWWLGALLFLGCILNKDRSVVEAKTERVVSLGIQKPNKRISDPKSLGLIEDPKNESGWYKTSQNSPFSVKIVDGQLIWKSFDTVNSEHVKEIADFYKKLGETRALHINTGIHGTLNGQTAVDGKSGRFTVEDIVSFEGYMYVSYHIVSAKSSPLTHSDIPHIDILDAWCYSNLTKDFSCYPILERALEIERIQKGSISGKDLSGYFSNLGYPSKIAPTSVYVPLSELEKNIEESLQISPFCYVRGIGGLGKSRVSYEIEKRYRKSIEEQGEKSSYLDTVYISLKSESEKESFFQHVRKKAGMGNEINPPVDKYFNLLGKAAQAKNKKVFIVIDNIDSDADFDVFAKLYKSLKEYHQQFQVLATGRLDISNFIKNQKNTSEKSIIEIESYCKSDLIAWEIFQENFLDVISIAERKKSQVAIINNKGSILKLFKKYDHHTGFIVILGRDLGNSYTFNSLSQDLQTLSKSIDEILLDSSKLNDYGILPEIIKTSLELSDKKYDGDASKVCNVLSLISNEPIRIAFFRSVMNKYYKNTPISNTKLNNILNHLKNVGIINCIREEEETFLKLPNFYNKLVRLGLFRKKTADMESLFSVVLEVIEEDSRTPRTQKRINENMMTLLTLFDLANVRDLKTNYPTYASINQKIANFAATRLNQVNCKDFFNLYNHFLLGIPDIPGYSLDPVLDAYIRDRDIDFLLNQLICQEMTAEKLKTLNNLFVLSLSQNKNPEKIAKKLKNHLNNNFIKFKLSKSDAQIIEKNLILTKEDQEHLFIFPQITFQPISLENLQKAEKWKKESPFNKGQKMADLSGKILDDGLGLLVHYLLVENEIEEIDLSHNSLGLHGHSAIKPVCTLLRYPGALKTLRLNDNHFHTNKQIFDMLLEGLRQNANLEALTLNNNSLGDEEIKSLCQALESHPRLKYIELDLNNFTGIGLDCLETLLCNNPNIRCIHTTDTHWFTSHDGTTLFERDSDNQLFKWRKMTFTEWEAYNLYSRNRSGGFSSRYIKTHICADCRKRDRGI
jgi:hypothetical protein